jgi:excinuclease UvrABC ATPase subunit
MQIKKYLSLVCISLFLVNIVSAQTFKYIGADKCKMCHNKAATGDQYNKWLKDPHSRAIATLSGTASLDYAKKNGIANPSKEAKCLKCHSTYEKAGASLRSSILPEEGVSCESCHGPGSAYKSPTIMKNKEMAMKNGLIMPDEKLCLSCHNKENPFFKEFTFSTYAAKIAHPNPAKK